MLKWGLSWVHELRIKKSPESLIFSPKWPYAALKMLISLLLLPWLLRLTVQVEFMAVVAR